MFPLVRQIRTATAGSHLRVSITAAAFPLAARLGTVLSTIALVLPTPTADGHVAGCHTRKCDRRISAKRHAHYWLSRFNAFPASWRQWAHSTSWCESNHRADTNTGNGFYGAFQYTLQTAAVAGFRRRPDFTTWHEQAVRSIRYAQRHGTGAWPICG